MKTAEVLSGLLCASVAGAQLHLPFSRAPSSFVGSPARRQLSRRDSSRREHVSARRRSLQVGLGNAEISYVVNVSVGTPPQSVSLIISPSSADTWVPYVQAYGCDATTTGSKSACLWGTFDNSKSSSYVGWEENETSYSSGSSSSSEFSVTYDDGSYVEGYYFTDVLKLASLSMANFTMGLGTELSRYIGSLGLGFQENYANFPVRLWDQGLINTTSYSIWLDSPDATSGNLLFGAIDTSKFDGTLSLLASSSSSSSYASFSATLSAINATGNSTQASQVITSEDLPLSVSVNPSDAISNLPPSIASQIWALAGATFDVNFHNAMIPCSAANSSSSMSISFKLGDYIGYSDSYDGYGSSGSSSGATLPGPVFTVPLADLVVPVDATAPGSSIFTSGGADSKLCLFGIQNGSGIYNSGDEYYGSYSLGSTLLRRVYAVFDLVNDEIALAPTRFDNTAASAVVPFPTYGATAPGATRPVCATGDVTCTTAPVVTTTGGVGGSNGGDGGSGGDYTYGSGKTPLSAGAIAGLVIVGVVGLAAVGGTLFVLLRFNRKKKDESALLAAKEEAAAESAPLASGALPAAVNGPPTAPGSRATENRPETSPRSGPPPENQPVTAPAAAQTAPLTSGAIPEATPSSLATENRPGTAPAGGQEETAPPAVAPAEAAPSVPEGESPPLPERPAPVAPSS